MGEKREREGGGGGEEGINDSLVSSETLTNHVKNFQSMQPIIHEPEIKMKLYGYPFSVCWDFVICP